MKKQYYGLFLVLLILSLCLTAAAEIPETWEEAKLTGAPYTVDASDHRVYYYTKDTEGYTTYSENWYYDAENGNRTFYATVDFHSGSNQEKNHSQTRWDPATGVATETMDITFDTDGNLVTENGVRRDPETGEIRQEYQISTNAQGENNNHTVTYQEAYTLDHTTITDKNGELIQDKEIYTDNKWGTVNINGATANADGTRNITTERYDANGNLQYSQVTQSMNPETGAYVSRDSVSFFSTGSTETHEVPGLRENVYKDSEGIIRGKNVQVINADGTIVNQKNYNAAGVLTMETDTNGDTTTIKYYDKNGSFLSSVIETKNGDTTVSKHYDAEGNLTLTQTRTGYQKAITKDADGYTLDAHYMYTDGHTYFFDGTAYYIHGNEDDTLIPVARVTIPQEVLDYFGTGKPAGGGIGRPGEEIPAPYATSGEWKQDENGSYFEYADGTLAGPGWVTINGNEYCFDASCYRKENTWEGDYYLTDDGTMAKDAWIGDAYVGADGKWVPGQPLWNESEDGWTYKDVAGQWLEIDGNWYYFDENGVMATNETRENYEIGDDGVAEELWHADARGWKYKNLKSSWAEIDGKWYYFDAYGYMVTDTTVQGYRLGPDGAMVHDSWYQEAGRWKYKNARSTWMQIDGKWYYFDGNGFMVTNAVIDGYQIGSDGVWTQTE